MLVLTREAGESVLIGENVVVTILSVQRGQVRVGITAPREVEILRDEVAERSAAPEGPSNHGRPRTP